MIQERKDTDIGFRVYIANILLLILLLTVSQVVCSTYTRL